jgi:hypothetical protein
MWCSLRFLWNKALWFTVANYQHHAWSFTINTTWQGSATATCLRFPPNVHMKLDFISQLSSDSTVQFLRLQHTQQFQLNVQQIFPSFMLLIQMIGAWKRSPLNRGGGLGWVGVGGEPKTSQTWVYVVSPLYPSYLTSFLQGMTQNEINH